MVTGSGRGIGAAIAKKLATRGFDVCVNCSSESGRIRSQELCDQLEREYGIQTLLSVADVSRAEEAKKLIDDACGAFGRIDVLVNNAGITRDALIMRMKDEDFDRVIEVNLKGVFNCCKAVTRHMMKQRYGRIVNMSSIVGIYGNQGQVNYAAAKAGVIGITKSLAKELASRGITVNAVAPGFIATDMTDALSEQQRAAIVERIASGRLGDANDVASVVAFLAGDEAAYVTGQVVCVDGGLSL